MNIVPKCSVCGEYQAEESIDHCNGCGLLVCDNCVCDCEENA